MTLSLFRTAKGIQLLGLVMVVAGVVATQLAPMCGSSMWAQMGMFAAVADLGAIALARGNGPIGLAILKLALVSLSVLSISSCAYILLPPPPFPTDLGFILILTSAAPSILGALLLRFAR